MMQTKATAGIAWMISATVLYTAANLCVKSLAHLPTEELVFLRSATSLILAGSWLLWKGKSLLGVNRKMVAHPRHFRDDWLGDLLSYNPLHSARERDCDPVFESHFHGVVGSAL